jgi:hypothetical protein
MAYWWELILPRITYEIDEKLVKIQTDSGSLRKIIKLQNQFENQYKQQLHCEGIAENSRQIFIFMETSI